MADDKVKIPEALTLQGLGALKKGQIRSRLHQARIIYKPRATKPDLIPLLALSSLGLIDKDHDADPAMLLKVTAWCGSLVGDLEQDLNDAGIKKGVNKWLSVENLIRNKYAENPDAGDGEPAGVASGSSSQVAKLRTKPPTATVMNFLLTSFHADMGKYAAEFDAAFPDCPVPQTRFLSVLDKMPMIRDSQHLSDLCTEPQREEYKLLSWISSNFGSNIIEATHASGMKVPGFPASVRQFVVAKPAPKHDRRFLNRMKKAKNKSILLFHGTCLQSVHSILRNGFTPAANKSRGAGVFMCPDPQLPYSHAYKFGWTPSWSNTPFKPHGVLLGCEVTGVGRPIGGAVHVITALDSIAVRYIFLLPLDQETAPSGRKVRSAMTAAFKVIRKKIEAAPLAEEEEVDEPDEEQEGGEGEDEVVEDEVVEGEVMEEEFVEEEVVEEEIVEEEIVEQEIVEQEIEADEEEPKVVHKAKRQKTRR